MDKYEVSVVIRNWLITADITVNYIGCLGDYEYAGYKFIGDFKMEGNFFEHAQQRSEEPSPDWREIIDAFDRKCLDEFDEWIEGRD